MSREEFEVFEIIRQGRKERRERRLAKADDTGWSKHTDHHWWRMLDGEKMHYWPSSNKWLYKGKYYRGALPQKYRDRIAASNLAVTNNA